MAFDQQDRLLLHNLISMLTVLKNDIRYIKSRLNIISQQEDSEMALIDDLEATVAQVVAGADSEHALLMAIHDELVAANVNNPRVQAVIDTLAQERSRIVAALAANPDPAVGP